MHSVPLLSVDLLTIRRCKHQLFQIGCKASNWPLSSLIDLHPLRPWRVQADLIQAAFKIFMGLLGVEAYSYKILWVKIRRRRGESAFSVRAVTCLRSSVQWTYAKKRNVQYLWIEQPSTSLQLKHGRILIKSCKLKMRWRLHLSIYL